jgi:protein-tyrosine-phosphatase
VTDGTAPCRIVFVCSGNICRSPAAMELARLGLARRGRADVECLSCGTLKLVGEPAAPFSVQLLAERGGDLSGHRSRAMSYFLLREADLVVGMEQIHRDLALDELGGDADLVAHGVHVITEWHPDPALRNDAGIYDFVKAPLDEYREGLAELECCVEGLLDELFDPPKVRCHT